MADRDQLESISSIQFPRGADKNNFFILCAYTRGKDLDYFTTDGRYYLKMIESLNVIRDTFESIGLCPQHLTDSYVSSLQ